MNPVAAAINDFVDGARLAPLWLRVGWEQVVARFRRTILGPFWLSANLLAISVALSFVFGGLMGQDYRSNFALIISGILSWSLVGALLGEAANVFITSAGLMHTQKLPLTFHVFLLMHRAFINFLAQLIAFWVVLAALGLASVPAWQFIPGLAVVLVNSFLLSLIVAIPSTRFRDINQLVQFLIQVLFFLTPIFWVPAQMKGKRRIAFELNPLAHELELIRQPLLGAAPAAENWVYALAFMGVLAVIAFAMMALFRRRVVFWL
jgi:ABC-type polysaccharide/polyol phosphate export permease